jgi:hypothetical protein
MVTVPVFEATTLDKAHSRIWTMANVWSAIHPKKWEHSFPTLRLTLPALLRSDVRR